MVAAFVVAHVNLPRLRVQIWSDSILSVTFEDSEKPLTTFELVKCKLDFYDVER